MKRKIPGFFAVAAIVLSMAGHAFAGNISWTNAGGDRLWDNAGNWTSADATPPPTAGDKTNIGSGATPTTGPIIDGTITAATKELDLGGSLDMTGGTLTVNSWMLVGYGGTSVGTLNLSGGTYTQPTNRTAFGFGATGNLNMTGGSIDLNGDLRFGENTTGIGNGIVDAGSILSNRLQVGLNGTGFLTLNGGTINTKSGQDVYLGASGTGVGHMSVNGGTLQPSNDIKVGDNGEGHLAITDGTVDPDDLYAGYNGSASAFISMSGGTLNVDQLILGRKGTCEMTMSAGVIENVANLEIGQQGGSSGKVTMSGGEISMRDDASNRNMLIGNSTGATGELIMSGGSIDVDWLLYVGHNGDGTLTMSGGEITAGGPLVVGRNATSTGDVSLDGGTLSASNIEMHKEAGAVSSLDMTEGTLILDSKGAFLGYIDDGYITAYDGLGIFNYDETTMPGKVIITAEIPEPASIVLLALGGLGLLVLRRRSA